MTYLPQAQKCYKNESFYRNFDRGIGRLVRHDAQPDVRIRAQERRRLCDFGVEDNGIGIAPQCQDRIFKVFERLHGTESYPGTGIGLAIVRKGAERMGGIVGIESEFRIRR
jgi:light-regulated signal transduction histidine kinase (bacteriophytochrome)